MPTIVFITTAILGLLLTAAILRLAQKKGNMRNYQHALIMGIGLFLTWLCSFFAPFLTPNLLHKVNRDLIVFGLVISTTAGLMAFFADYIFLFARSTKRSSQKGKEPLENKSK